MPPNKHLEGTKGFEEAPVLAPAAGRMLLWGQQCAGAGTVSPVFLLNLPLLIPVQPAVPSAESCAESCQPPDFQDGGGEGKGNGAGHIQLQTPPKLQGHEDRRISAADFFLQLSINGSFCLQRLTYVIIKGNPSLREQAASQALPAGVSAHCCPTLSKQVLLCEAAIRSKRVTGELQCF